MLDVAPIEVATGDQISSEAEGPGLPGMLEDELAVAPRWSSRGAVERAELGRCHGVGSAARATPIMASRETSSAN